ncbi:50S ribosomal protein L24 [Marinitenerispora sediminis]|uniref:Large ribosomal subunit protein uL24 n=1 Tax=Marinitenerispora sediminis TaxID=1931232 RepID=A0A368TAZ9_9ACTN|nr:50S ribosomal protein L24 [Marinitenerispora sediminis]RCV55551.1 50S ribosomal protein L24 [Marinitenerispora sediminis]RCV61879.1 50S ribosomal protein L24 [Marinitenerispora sediminis]RCV62255.1 50S ribosomal protein L24 [Marinitenerispora sediminis]
MKIKKDDEVIVIAGKDKGATGKVLRALPKEQRVVVEGVNLIKKHKKANQAGGQQGEVVTQEAPIHVSNVAIVEDGKPTRVGYRFEEDGTKVRISRRTGKDI